MTLLILFLAISVCHLFYFTGASPVLSSSIFPQNLLFTSVLFRFFPFSFSNLFLISVSNNSLLRMSTPYPYPKPKTSSIFKSNYLTRQSSKTSFRSGHLTGNSSSLGGFRNNVSIWQSARVLTNERTFSVTFARYFRRCLSPRSFVLTHKSWKALRLKEILKSCTDPSQLPLLSKRQSYPSHVLSCIQRKRARQGLAPIVQTACRLSLTLTASLFLVSAASKLLTIHSQIFFHCLVLVEDCMAKKQVLLVSQYLIWICIQIFFQAELTSWSTCAREAELSSAQGKLQPCICSTTVWKCATKMEVASKGPSTCLSRQCFLPLTLRPWQGTEMSILGRMRYSRAPVQ